MQKPAAQSQTLTTVNDADRDCTDKLRLLNVRTPASARNSLENGFFTLAAIYSRSTHGP